MRNLRVAAIAALCAFATVDVAKGNPQDDSSVPPATVVGSSRATELKPRAEGASDHVIEAPAGTERLRIDSDSGFVRIGPTGAPSALLHLRSDVDAQVKLQADNPNIGAAAGALMNVNADVSSVNLMSHGSGRTLQRWGFSLSGWSEILQWRGAGLVLGTSQAVPVVIGTNNTNRLHIAADGKIGIGTPDPTGPLHLYGSATSDAIATFGVHAANGPALNLGYAAASLGQRSVGFMNMRPDALATWPNPSLRFMTANVSRLMITRSGSIGINMQPAETSPYIFDVNGSVHVSGSMVVDGNLAAKYQDLAEWVPSAADLTPGTVVVVDATVGNGVTTTSAPYDTTVAGVISAQPGIILGEAGARKEQVATTGRVRVKADASHGAIRVGDLLVTSSRPGFATRSIPIEVAGVTIHRPGTILGKALEALDSGSGEILVLLSLQ